MVDLLVWSERHKIALGVRATAHGIVNDQFESSTTCESSGPGPERMLVEYQYV